MKNVRFILTIIILLATAGANYYFSKPDLSLSRKSLAEFPKQVGEWVLLNEHAIDGMSMKVLQVDDYFMRDYRNSRGEVIGLYVGYFKSQREGKGIHSPRLCLPGAGWVAVDVSVYPLPVPAHNPETIPVNKFMMGKGLDRQLYLFWYQGRGRIYASEYWNKIYLIWDGLTKRRTDGALIRVNNPVIGNPNKALQTQQEFINQVFPLLKDYIPE